MSGTKGRSGTKKPRKPTALKLVDGTFRKDRAPSREPRPRGFARCPSWLPAEARAEWNRLAPELERLGLLTRVDRATFAAYCIAWSDLRWAVEFLKYQKRIVQTPNGHRQIHPAMTVRRQAAEQVVKFSTEFGLTPSARARLEEVITPPPVEPGATSGDDEETTAEKLLGS